MSVQSSGNGTSKQKARNENRSELKLFILFLKMHKHKHDYADNLKYCAGKKDILEIGQICEQINCRINACKGRPNQKRKTYEL